MLSYRTMPADLFAHAAELYAYARALTDLASGLADASLWPPRWPRVQSVGRALEVAQAMQRIAALIAAYERYRWRGLPMT